MNRLDKIKLRLTRNWKFPGQERLGRLFKPSQSLQVSFQNSIIWLSDEPLAIFSSANNYIEATILSTGTYEAEIEKLIAISLKEGDTALDIGANIGLQSLRMGRYCGKNGRVLAYEPLNYLQEKFNKNIALNGLENVQLFPYALSDYDSEISYLIDETAWNQGTFSLGNLKSGATSQKVIIKTGDLLPEIIELDSLQLIKIDVEGFELQVMQGLTRCISKFRPRIIFEYDENYWVKNNQRIHECFDFLNRLNYTVYQITDIGCLLITNPVSIESGNIFCIPEKSL
ncbi:FkbM family methyltransferase [Daejeonella oryzae]|uniref:FkbM family methyltransferase n=1 Tax=Daejeonella oryzae TaxID=1122943 RepID=UPI00041891B6|nr:FkbM family methyltransferase [Daejeonella oryzae]